MGIEIEHKYLVKNDLYKSQASSCHHIVQGYLNRDPERTVRIRIRDEKAYLTVKGKNHGATRLEFEYDIPVDDALRMMRICEGTVIEKIRYHVNYEGHLWEVDEFSGSHEGLVTAEIELKSESEEYSLPDFIGENVTGNKAYYNSNL